MAKTNKKPLFQKTVSKVSNFFSNLKPKQRAKNAGTYASKTIEAKPFKVFFTLLGILLILIVVGSILRKPAEVKNPPIPTKTVNTYRIGTAPKVHVEAQIEKSGVIKIVALTPGVVSQINVSEGQQVDKGTNLISLSTNYSGGNAASIQRQIAATQYQNVKDTYATQSDVINKQRQIADQNKDNTDQMRAITNQSVSDTQGVITLNNDTLSALYQQLQSTPNDPALRGQISQLQAANNQLASAQRQAQYQSNTDNPPTQLANLQHDLAMRQLDLQQKALELSLETSKLNLALAQVNEATMFPSAPFAGVVERIYVNVGDNVNPGTPLLLLHGAEDLKLFAKVPAYIAQHASPIEESTIYLGNNQTIKLTPSYISNEATDGSLYSILYSIPDDIQGNFADNSYLSVDIPVGYADTSAVVPFIPIDSVYQSQNSAYVFVNRNGKAASREVKLGTVFGEFVEIDSGLTSGDEVITSRNVLNGDPVKSN